MLSGLNYRNLVNWRHPLNRGLVAWWLVVPQWKGGTVWRDLVGMNHGTLTAMDPATDWVPTTGKGGWGALDFDGSDDYVLASHVPQIVGSDLTLVGSFFLTSVSGNHWHLRQYSGNDGPALYSVGSELRWQVGKSTNGRIDTTTSANVWQQIAAVCNASTLELFINGVSVSGPTAVTVQNTSTDNFRIGGPTEFGVNHFEGLIDDVRIFNRALSGAEIGAVYADSLANHSKTLNRLRRPIGQAPVVSAGTILPQMLQQGLFVNSC